MAQKWPSIDYFTSAISEDISASKQNGLDYGALMFSCSLHACIVQPVHAMSLYVIPTISMNLENLNRVIFLESVKKIDRKWGTPGFSRVWKKLLSQENYWLVCLTTLSVSRIYANLVKILGWGILPKQLAKLKQSHIMVRLSTLC